MIGRRVDTQPHLMQPGDFGRWEADNNHWYACAPDGKLANLSLHQVQEHEDGTVTVSPSILVRQGDQPEWHGYLERGVWRSV